MARSQENFLNVIAKAQCCAADMAWKALKQEMFLKADRVTAFKNVRVINYLVKLLNRYYTSVYIDSEDSCLSSTDIENIIEQIQMLCDNCGCCSDVDTLLKDI
jgi:hypothetical protein